MTVTPVVSLVHKHTQANNWTVFKWGCIRANVCLCSSYNRIFFKKRSRTTAHKYKPWKKNYPSPVPPESHSPVWPSIIPVYVNRMSIFFFWTLVSSLLAQFGWSDNLSGLDIQTVNSWSWWTEEIRKTNETCLPAVSLLCCSLDPPAASEC